MSYMGKMFRVKKERAMKEIKTGVPKRNIIGSSLIIYLRYPSTIMY